MEAESHTGTRSFWHFASIQQSTFKKNNNKEKTEFAIVLYRESKIFSRQMGGSE